MRILNRQRATFLLPLPVEDHTCSAETVSDTLSFSHMAREASQSLLLPSDSSSTIFNRVIKGLMFICHMLTKWSYIIYAVAFTLFTTEG